MQQACGIIQSAAHEDANIIFGAVMDEKMKDAVKITVIATGFKEVPTARHRQQETRMPFVTSHASALDDDFPEAPGRRDADHRDPMPEPPQHIMAERADDFANHAHENHAYADDAAMPMAQPEPQPVSLDAMRSNVLTSMSGNFQQDDLDVPAFLRKRI